MAQSDARWVEVSKSAFAHETDGLATLRYIMPKAAPYRAWTNFEFIGNYRQSRGIDSPALRGYRLHPGRTRTTRRRPESHGGHMSARHPTVCATDAVDAGTALGQMSQIG